MRRLRYLVLMAVLATGALATSAPVRADTADSCGTATPIATSPDWTSDTLETGDRDWYRFSLSIRRRVIITLGALPANARLDLYGACSNHLAESDRPGQGFEELVRMLDPGTYRVRIRPVGTWAQAMPYRLRVRAPRRAVVVLSSSGWNEFPTQPRVVGEVLNNTGSAREDVRIRIRFYDAAGRLLRTGVTFARRERFGPGQRSMFVWANEIIPGYDHHEVEVTDAPIASVPPTTGLVVHREGTSDHGFGVLSYDGTLENTTRFTVTQPRVSVTIYDGLGRVRNADFAGTDVDPLGPFESGAYTVLLNDRNTGDKVVIAGHGNRGPGG
ncbi:MAG: FxLYD domain-containing protein [Candidatus Limnocylindrales bacterium]